MFSYFSRCLPDWSLRSAFHHHISPHRWIYLMCMLEDSSNISIYIIYCSEKLSISDRYANNEKRVEAIKIMRSEGKNPSLGQVFFSAWLLGNLMTSRSEPPAGVRRSLFAISRATLAFHFFTTGWYRAVIAYTYVDVWVGLGIYRDIRRWEQRANLSLPWPSAAVQISDVAIGKLLFSNLLVDQSRLRFVIEKNKELRVDLVWSVFTAPLEILLRIVQ